VGLGRSPGQTTDAKGFVQILTAPAMENGKTEDEPALWVHLQYTNDGWIQVEYPALQVYPVDKFVAFAGCLKDNLNCKVIFSLNYRIDNGDVKNLATWTEVYNGEVTRISLDLSSLAGLQVKFILRVDAWGNADADHAFWLNPHIQGLPRLDQKPFCPICD
jgi:hypothetical protein